MNHALKVALNTTRGSVGCESTPSSYLGYGQHIQKSFSFQSVSHI